MPDLSIALANRQPLVAGAAGDREVLHANVAAAECDLIELRLDLLGAGEDVRAFADRHRATHPILITARHPDEGGSGALTAAQRADALAALLPRARLLDLELRSLPELEAIWAEAGRRGVLRVASWHNFDACPGVEELAATVAAMHEAGADVAKLAFRLAGPGDLAAISGVLSRRAPLPVAIMGMGPLAPVSRLLAAHLGSVLNYGYLGKAPTAPGQWPARLLKEAIARSLL